MKGGLEYTWCEQNLKAYSCLSEFHLNFLKKSCKKCNVKNRVGGATVFLARIALIESKKLKFRYDAISCALWLTVNYYTSDSL